MTNKQTLASDHELILALAGGAMALPQGSSLGTEVSGRKWQEMSGNRDSAGDDRSISASIASKQADSVPSNVSREIVRTLGRTK